MSSYFCTACQQLFADEKAYRHHRIGSFRWRTRRCLSEYEMSRMRLYIKEGQWYLTRSIDFLAGTTLQRRA